ncbi:hypothetical protein A2Z67_04555 [Candidatus Woesebacteria bacterium RBG_13_36_22]|uniref:Uncharacterized protein n=1 Tax=Candidatus Woesebacteria bacterium RBG_13_36_22 TaxID=1802478 RepID=A0A1F7X2S3_9BACT|nr:MAG: hypothetical protein A2Z67_04555 [Candidatus Woesebacteria bacterium RBG_13_36_22]
MTTYHFINDLSKSDVTVKPFVRTKKGKLEHVKGHTRYVIGQPISVSDQAEWIQKQKTLLENIKDAFIHGDFSYLGAVQELKTQFNMGSKEATTYADQWSAELKAKSAMHNLHLGFLEAEEHLKAELKPVTDKDFLDALKKDWEMGLENKEFIQEAEVIKLLEDKGFDNSQIDKILTEWKAEIPISASIPPPPQELLGELKLSAEAVLGISNSSIEQWAKLTDAQHKEIEQVKKQFFYYKINKVNAISRLIFITGIGKNVEDQAGIDDLGKIVDEWAKNKYKYSKEKAKYTKGKKPIPYITEEVSEEVKVKPYESLEEKLLEPVKIIEELPEKVKVKPPKLSKPSEKVSQTILQENLVPTGQGKLGSNPGGVYTDKQTGKKYYVKAYPDKQGVDSGSQQARVEQLSNKIYQHLGIATATTELVMMKDFGKLSIASEWIDGAAAVPTDVQEHSKDVINGFVADAYLMNWDVAGLTFDNIVKNPVTGQLIRQDNGGTMMFRAQGSPKEFNPNAIPELDSMRNPQHGAGKIFKGVTEADIKSQAQYLVSTLKLADIERLVDDSGLTGEMRLKALVGLNGRRQVLIDKYALAVPAEEQTVFALYEGATTAMKEGFTTVGTHHSAVKGKLLAPIPGFEDLEFFQFKNSKGEYGIAEKTTGLPSSSGSYSTEKEALDKLKENLTKHGYEYTKNKISGFEHKAPQIPHESQLKAPWAQADYKLPNGKMIKTGDWIKYHHANVKHHYKVASIYSNNKLHIEEWDNWSNKIQEFDLNITSDIDKTVAPTPKEKSPPPSVAITPDIFHRINNVWAQAKSIENSGGYEAKVVAPKLKKFNESLKNAFEETPYIFRAVGNEAFHKSMKQVLNEHVLTGSSHALGTTCCSISPWSSLGFGSHIFVLDKKKLVEHSDWVKPIQYYNYALQEQEPGTFKGKSSEHDDIYTAHYVKEMEVRAKHIHDPLSVIAEVWIHKEGIGEEEKFQAIEEVESKYPQLKGKVKVLNIYKDLPWPKGMAKSIKRSLEGLKW